MLRTNSRVDSPKGFDGWAGDAATKETKIGDHFFKRNIGMASAKGGDSKYSNNDGIKGKSKKASAKAGKANKSHVTASVAAMAGSTPPHNLKENLITRAIKGESAPLTKAPSAAAPKAASGIAKNKGYAAGRDAWKAAEKLAKEASQKAVHSGELVARAVSDAPRTIRNNLAVVEAVQNHTKVVEDVAAKTSKFKLGKKTLIGGGVALGAAIGGGLYYKSRRDKRNED